MVSPASAPTIEYLDAKDQVAVLQEENTQLWKAIEMMVSILVFVELALDGWILFATRALWKCFNPCFRGTCS